jgi:hypothetical protein
MTHSKPKTKLSEGLLDMLFSRTPFKMKWFYNLEGHKTKFNWFLMEIALEYYDYIMDSQELESYRKEYDEKQIAQYCTYYARRLKESLLKYLRGQRKRVIFYIEYVEDFYPHHSESQNRILNKIALEAFEHMTSACKSCPQQCLRDHSSISNDFEIYKDEDYKD